MPNTCEPNDLIFELYTEEVPANVQPKVAEEIFTNFQKNLRSLQLTSEKEEYFYTPQRLIILVKGLKIPQNIMYRERKGPSKNAPSKALEGFFKAAKESFESCILKDTPKGPTWFAIFKTEGESSTILLKNIFERLLRTYSWTKSMTWDKDCRWIRPVRNILCLLNQEIIPIHFSGCQAKATTLGHRFMSPNAFIPKNCTDYLQQLRNNFVIYDHQERMHMILEECQKIITKLNVTHKNVPMELMEDPQLLHEIAMLVEYPVPLLGSFDEKFLKLPPIILTTAMRVHQKYFSLQQSETVKNSQDTSRQLVPFFIVVSNIENNSENTIIQGNERVLRARLEDALFFWIQDTQTPLAHHIKNLEYHIFHEKIGSQAQHIQNMKQLAPFVYSHFNLHITDLENTIELCKVDLVSKTVNEFPTLQGMIIKDLLNSYNMQENFKSIDSIQEHYLPLGPHTSLPTSNMSQALSICDKFSTLISFWNVHERPSSTKDPYALRRSTLGIIRILFEYDIPLDIDPLVLHFTQDKASALDLIKFIRDRFIHYLKDQNFSHNSILCVLNAKAPINIQRMKENLIELEHFRNIDAGRHTLQTLKRIVHILPKHHKTFSEKVPFIQPAEKNLMLAFNTLPKNPSLYQLQSLTPLIEIFFNDIFINSGNDDAIASRFSLLSSIVSTMEEKFSVYDLDI